MQVCTLRSEARPPEEAFNPKVKRSGWQAPEDTGLWDTANDVKDQASCFNLMFICVSMFYFQLLVKGT